MVSRDETEQNEREEWSPLAQRQGATLNSTRVSSSSSPTATATACQAGDEDIEECDDGVDDSGEDCSDSIYDGPDFYVRIEWFRYIVCEGDVSWVEVGLLNC